MPLKLTPPRQGKSPYYYVRGTYLGNSLDRSTKTTDRKTAARILAKWKAEIERGEFSQPGEPTFLSASVAYMQAGGEQRFLEPIVNKLGYRLLRTLDQIAIDAAANEIYPKASAQTKNRQFYTPVSAVLKHAGIDMKIKRPKGWRGNKSTTWLKPEEAFRLFRAADKKDKEFGLFLRLLCYTGMRLSDGLNLKIENVDLRRASAYIPKTKNTNPRTCHLPPGLVAALANHPRGMKREGKVFRFSKNGRLYVLLNAAKKACGLKLPPREGSFHALSHTWATWMAQYAGLQDRELLLTGRWDDLSSVARYAHLAASASSKKANLLPVEKTWKR